MSRRTSDGDRPTGVVRIEAQLVLKSARPAGQAAGWVGSLTIRTPARSPLSGGPLSPSAPNTLSRPSMKRTVSSVSLKSYGTPVTMHVRAHRCGFPTAWLPLKCIP
jgi:hypothetical protein